MIITLRYLDEKTNTAAALRYVTNTMFSPSNGDRSGIPNVAIVITDGVPNVPNESEVISLKSDNRNAILCLENIQNIGMSFNKNLLKKLFLDILMYPESEGS